MSIRRVTVLIDGEVLLDRDGLNDLTLELAGGHATLVAQFTPLADDDQLRAGDVWVSSNPTGTVIDGPLRFHGTAPTVWTG